MGKAVCVSWPCRTGVYDWTVENADIYRTLISVVGQLSFLCILERLRRILPRSQYSSAFDRTSEEDGGFGKRVEGRRQTKGKTKTTSDSDLQTSQPLLIKCETAMACENFYICGVKQQTSGSRLGRYGVVISEWYFGTSMWGWVLCMTPKTLHR